jgi:hypothetical protein
LITLSNPLEQLCYVLAKMTAYLWVIAAIAPGYDKQNAIAMAKASEQAVPATTFHVNLRGNAPHGFISQALESSGW